MWIKYKLSNSYLTAHSIKRKKVTMETIYEDNSLLIKKKGDGVIVVITKEDDSTTGAFIELSCFKKKLTIHSEETTRWTPITLMIPEHVPGFVVTKE